MTMLEEPECQENYGNNVGFESEAYGFKVTGKFSWPDMVLLGDEVGDNIDMTVGGHIVGNQFLCENFCIAQIK